MNSHERKRRTRSEWLYAVGTLLVAAMSLLGVERLGRGARTFGAAHLLRASELPVRLVQNANEALAVWQSGDLRGRVLVYASSHLHFVDPEEPFAGLDLEGFPFDLAAIYGRGGGDEGFLWAATRLGIAREVVHLVPPEVLAEKMVAVGLQGGDRIVVRDLGLLRTIAARPPALEEPALVGVDASLFDSPEGPRLLAELFASGLESDLLVVNLAADSAGVSEAARQRADAWYRSLRPAGSER